VMIGRVSAILRLAGRQHRLSGEAQLTGHAEDEFATTRYANVDGLRIAYRQAGTGPPLFLIHGLRGSSRYWNQYAPVLSQQFTVIAADLKGFGESAKPRHGYSPDDHARLMKGLLHLLQVERAIVLGYSLGGIVALRLAMRYPDLVERLVLVATPLTKSYPENSAEILESPFHMRWLMQYPRSSRVLLGIRSQRLLRRVGNVQSLPEAVIEDATKFRWASLVQTFRACIVFDNMKRHLAQITAPTLVIWGQIDSLVRVHHAYQFGAMMHDARVTVIPNADHDVLLTHARDCLSVIAEFLGRVPLRAAQPFARDV